jgi:hypothetical protein
MVRRLRSFEWLNWSGQQDLNLRPGVPKAITGKPHEAKRAHKFSQNVSGHKGGVAGIYNRAAYEAEKATALCRWAERVAAIVEGRKSNVTPLRGVS